jgi:subtilisin-like proprotein convertase family protein
MRGALRLSFAVAVAAVLAVPVHAQIFSNPAPITIGDPPTSAAADPYAATLTVSGMTGTITDIDVQLSGVRHTFPDDVDIMLVGPTGAATLLISDAGGGTDVTGIGVGLDDEAAGVIPDGGPLTGGLFRPSNFEATVDAFPAPAPASPGTAALTIFDGTDPNGVWSLYAVDDSIGDGGRLDTGFQLLITTTTTPATLVSASAPIRLYDRIGIGAPNPSDIVVSGAGDTIVSMTVTLTNLTHPNPDDLDFLLVGPGGTTYVMFSDAGGTTDVVGANITLDDLAATVLPDSAAITSGSFQPRNYGVPDQYRFSPLPPYNNAATGGAATFDSLFAGTNPNGTWSLYVADDGIGSTGTIAGGWSIDFELTPVELMEFRVE